MKTTPRLVIPAKAGIQMQSPKQALMLRSARKARLEAWATLRDERVPRPPQGEAPERHPASP
jgi:hypothetical protein